MAVKIAAWNVREGLAQPNEMPEAVEHIKQLDADVVVLSDAFSLRNTLHGSQTETLHEATGELINEGYSFRAIEYKDTEPFRHDRHLAVLSRLQARSSAIRLATRNTLELKVKDPASHEEIHVIGAHFDDRCESTREQHVRALIEHLEGAGDFVALAGDLNAMHASDKRARFVRSRPVRLIAQHLSSDYRRGGADRLIGMAQGDSLDLLKQHGLEDADWRHKPTWSAGLPLLQWQLDRIMLSDRLKLERFERAEPTQVSDHRAITATVFAA